MAEIELGDKDLFFLDIQDAYRMALKQNKFLAENGRERLQFCYYDGSLTDITLPNFIKISVNDFINEFSRNRLPVPKWIVYNLDGVLQAEPVPEDILAEIQQFRSVDIFEEINKLRRQLNQYVFDLDTDIVQRLDDKLTLFRWRDSYFVDPLLALNVAKQKNRVYCGHPSIDGLQICYYRGALPTHQIENLISVELDQFLDFFTLNRYRLPELIEVPEELDAGLKVTLKDDIEYLVGLVKNKRMELVQQFASIAKSLTPGFDPDQPLRVFIPSNRLTTVMQYCSANLAKAFESLGYQVLFYIEDNEMMESNLVDYLQRYIEFNPHIVVNVNYLNNSFLNDQVTNIIWWQDPMSAIMQHKPLAWREKDYSFSFSPFLDKHILQCAAKQVYRQHFVIDESVFNCQNVTERAEKIVFVGSSCLSFVNLQDAEHSRIIMKLLEVISRDQGYDEAVLQEICSESRLSYDFLLWKVLAYVVRDYTVQWLCEVSSLPVAVYGRFWEKSATVSPYFMGELPHGEAVANVYKSVKYALVSHPFEISSQRLAEVMACGCIPVVYDCRKIAERPHWEDYCLFFNTPAQLNEILAQGRQPRKPPEEAAEFFSYQGAVKNFIAKSARLENLE